MNFLHAGLLAAGLSAVSIPILIHLLMRRRRTPVPWGAMRFIMEAYKRTRRRLLIERWLLLAARCLLIAAVAFALARPFLDGATGAAVARTGGRTVFLLVDNSIAAQAEASGSSALARHQESARATLAALGDGDRAGLILLGGPADDLVIPPSANLASVLDLLNRATPTDSRADLSGALASVVASITQERARDPRAAPVDQTFVVLCADLPRGSADLESALPRLPAGVRLLATTPASDAANANVSIVAATPQRTIILPDQADLSQTVAVTLRRSGAASEIEREQITRVTLRLFGPPASATSASASASVPAAVGEAVVTWSPGQREAAVTVAFAPPVSASGTPNPTDTTRARADERPSILVTSIDRDPVPGDNASRVAIERRDTLRVGLVASRRVSRGSDPSLLTSGDWLALALRPRDDSAIEVIELDPSPLDAARLGGLDALIITTPDRLNDADWAAVRSFALARGAGRSSERPAVVFVTPPGDKTVHTWPDAFARGLNLDWSIAREARAFDSAATPPSPPPPVPSITPAAADASRLIVPDRATAASSLLTGLRAELAELARPVTVHRILPLLTPPEGATAELTLADGTGVLWVATLSDKPRASGSAAAPVSAPETRPASESASGSGLLVYLAVAPELRWTDLPVKPLMVPLIQEILREGIGAARGGGAGGAGSTTAGTAVVAPPQTVLLRPRTELAAERQGLTDFQVDATGTTVAPIRTAGVWDGLDQAGAPRGFVVINADAPGGDLSPQAPASTGPWLSRALAAGAVEWFSTSDTPRDPTAVAGNPARIETALARGIQQRASGPWWLAAALLLALTELLLAWRSTPKV